MAKYDLSTASNLFKIKYGKLSDNVYNSSNVTLGRVKKSYDFVGKQMLIAQPLSFAGGVGAGLLPTSNYQSVADIAVTAKKVYSTVQIDREAIKASSENQGAFIEMTKHAAQRGVESFMRVASMFLFGNSDGSLGTVSANASGTAADPVVVISAATWKEASFEEKDYVNCGTDASVFEIIAVVPATRTVTLNRISGALDLTAAGSGLVVYLQNSKDMAPSGLKAVCDATTGTLYGIPVSRRWQASQIAAAGAGITPDLMNQLMLDVQRKSGKVPNLIVTSFTQYRKILNVLEDQKEYLVEPRSEDLKGKISFRGLEFMSSAGAVPIFPERFVEDDRLYALNDHNIHLHHRPDFGWFDDDGSVFMRVGGGSGSIDAYGATYGGYYENLITPSFQGVITGLAT